MGNVDGVPGERSNRLPVLITAINTALADVDRHSKATVAGMMTVGDHLIEAKALVGRGNWLDWLKANFPNVSQRTAHLYMQLAKRRSTIERAMKSATVADLERDRLGMQGGLAVGPFGVADALAAIYQAEQHENRVEENRRRLANLDAELKAAAVRSDLGRCGAEARSQRRTSSAWQPDMAELVEDLANHAKLCLSRLGTDPHRRAEFLRQAHSILDAMKPADE